MERPPGTRRRTLLSIYTSDNVYAQQGNYKSGEQTLQVKEPAWQREARTRRPSGMSQSLFPVLHNPDRELRQSKDWQGTWMRKLRNLLIEVDLTPEKPRREQLSTAKSPPVVSSIVREELSSSMSMTVRTSKPAQREKSMFDESNLTVDDDWTLGNDSSQQSKLGKKKKLPRRRKTRRVARMLPSISRDTSMEKSLSEPDSPIFSPKHNQSQTQTYPGYLDEIKEKPSIATTVNPFISPRTSPRQTAHPFMSTRTSPKQKSTPLSQDPNYKFRLKRGISGQKLSPRQSKLDQINQIVDEAIAFEADKSGRDSIQDFIQKNKTNAAQERQLMQKVHDVIEMIKEASENNPEILESILDTKQRNRHIDNRQILSKGNVDQVQAENLKVTKFVNLMTLNTKKKKLWKRIKR